MKFNVSILRTSYAYGTLEIEANSPEEAESKARDEAGDHEYSEKDADYSIESIVPFSPVVS